MNKIKVKRVLNKHKKRDEWFLDDYSINPYYGCSFNCIYCYIRGSKYGENMSKNLSAKINAPEILEKELTKRAERKEYGFIALSSATEPYIKEEKELKLTRKILEIILKYRFPVHILTKSKLVLRDMDILKEIDKNAILPDDLKSNLNHGTIITFSISILDEKIAKIIEPGAPLPQERLETMQKCKENGFLTGIAFIPILPFISDSEKDIERMIKTAKDFKADYVFVGALTLFGTAPSDCKTLYYKFLERYYPELIPKYQNLFKRPYPSLKYQKNLEKITVKFCKKYKIKNRIINKR